MWSRWRPRVADRVIKITACGFSQSLEEIWRQRHTLQSSFLSNITNPVPEWNKVWTVLFSFFQSQGSGIKTDPIKEVEGHVETDILEKVLGSNPIF